MIEKYIAELKPHEMALRLAEAATGRVRDKTKTAEQNMATLRDADPEAVNDYKRVQ